MAHPEGSDSGQVMSGTAEAKTLLLMLGGAAIKYYDARTDSTHSMWDAESELKSAAKAYGEYVRKHAKDSTK